MHTGIAETERLLTQMQRAFDEGALNISPLEVDRSRVKRELRTCSWELFVQKADYSYFTARVLLSQGVHLYGLFCAHQCVEVYLKAALRHASAPVPTTHKLLELLEALRSLQPDGTTFFHSTHAKTVCSRYEPFYEIARYPIQISRPVDGKYVWISGVDETILDYFVHRTREQLTLPENGWDILSEQGHIDLQLVREMHPQFYALFMSGNVNFPGGGRG